MVEHFDGFVLEPSGQDPVSCKSFKQKHRDKWFVGVLRVDMSHGSGPSARSDLLNEKTISEVRQLFYSELIEIGRFRRAVFGRESWDWVAIEPSADGGIDEKFMLSLKSLFSKRASNDGVQSFSKEYQITTKFLNSP